MAAKHVSLPSVFAEGNPMEWFRRFDICCAANNWENKTKAKKLPTLLEGEALAVWLELTPDEQKYFEVAKRKIIGQMGLFRLVSLDHFLGRRLRPGESLSVFVHDLKRLLEEQAMSDTQGTTRDQLLHHQFLTGLPTQASKQLRAINQSINIIRMLKSPVLGVVLYIQVRQKSVLSLSVQEYMFTYMQGVIIITILSSSLH